MNVYFISDTHFNHKNIIDYTSRDFRTVEDMNKHIITEWNKIVRGKDTVYFLGDFCFGKKETWKHFLDQLNGTIHIVLGNHDGKRSAQWYRDVGFDRVYHHPIILDDFYILSHKPIEFLNTKMPYANIHGHTHDECFASDQRINVCVEVLDFKPIEFNEIKARFKNEEILF